MIRRWRLSFPRQSDGGELAVPGAGNPGAGWLPRVRDGPVGRRGGALDCTLQAHVAVFPFFFFLLIFDSFVPLHRHLWPQAIATLLRSPRAVVFCGEKAGSGCGCWEWVVSYAQHVLLLLVYYY